MSRRPVQRLAAFRIQALAVHSYVGPVAPPEKVTIEEENKALQTLTARHYDAIPPELFRQGKMASVSVLMVWS